MWSDSSWIRTGTDILEWTDVVGLLSDPELAGLAWTPTAWLELGTGTGESDRCGRTLLGSGTGTDRLESDRCGRTRIGPWTFLADSNSLAGLHCLAGLGLLGWTPTAWLDPEQ